jgi:glycosyltransferase involved in cell wall biosynthesis
MQTTIQKRASGNKRSTTFDSLSYEYSDQLVQSKSPVVSVLMLAYNHAKYICQAIEGVAAQKTSCPIELIIGEDCSPDNTLDVALSYQKKYPDLIRIITGDVNVGSRKNSYRLETAARGKYIAYCEGDDYWHDPIKLQNQVDFLETNPDYGLVFTNADSFDVTTGKRTKFAVPVRPELCEEDDPYVQQLTGAMIIWPLTVCVRKELSLQILKECPEITDPSYAMGDTQRYLEIAHRTKIKYMPLSTATRNLLPESATHSNNIDKKAKFIESSQRLTLHYLDKYPLPSNRDREVRTWVAKRALYYAYLCQDSKKASAEMKALRSLGDGVPWKYHLYAFGSQNMITQHIVSFMFELLKIMSTAKKDIKRNLKKLATNKIARNSHRYSKSPQ